MNPFLSGQEAPIVTNVAPHCVAVAYVAANIANIFGLSDEEQKEVTSGAIEHNLAKGIEVAAKVANRAGVNVNPYASDFLSSQTTHGALSAAGYSDDLIGQIAQSGVNTGHVSLASFLKLDASGKLILNADAQNIIDLKRMIIHLADDMVCSPKPTKEYPEPKTFISTLAGRMAASGFMLPTGYPFMYFSGLMAGPNGKVGETGKIPPIDSNVLFESNELWVKRAKTQYPEAIFVDTFASLQVRVNDLILDQLANRLEQIDRSASADLGVGVWLVNRIDERLNLLNLGNA